MGSEACSTEGNFLPQSIFLLNQPVTGKISEPRVEVQWVNLLKCNVVKLAFSVYD